MKQVKGWFLPDWDTHLAEFIEHKTQGEYQLKQRQYALSKVTLHRTAIDVGANIGTWTRDLSEQFERVICFEPQSDCRECHALNVPTAQYTNVELHPHALGPMEGEHAFYVDKTSCGNAGLNRQGVLDGPTKDKPNAERLAVSTVSVIALDSLELDDVDFIKIDTQGFERQVLESAEKTLEVNSPTLCLELADRTPQEHQEKLEILTWLNQRGYALLGNCVKEHVFAKRV